MSRRARQPLTPAFPNRMKKPLITNDQFPLLECSELAQCLQECDFDANEELVARPTAPFLHYLFLQILDTFLGYTPEAHASLAKSRLKRNPLAATDLPLEPDLDDTPQTVNLTLFYRAVAMFLEICGISDFSFSDLIRPDPLRTQRVLSAVINFARFREENLRVCEPFAHETEDSTKELTSIQDLNKELAQKVDKLSGRLQQDKQGSLESSLTQLLKYNTKLEQELIKLQKSQEVFKKEHLNYKSRKANLINQLETQHFLLSEAERELMRIQGYALIDAPALRKVVASTKANIESLETQEQQIQSMMRNRSTTGESIQTSENELRTLVTIVQEVLNDARALEKANANHARHCEELKKQQELEGELADQLDRLTKQVQRAKERVLRVSEQSEQQERADQALFEALDQKYEEFCDQRNAKEEEHARIQKENLMLEGEINREKHEAEVERRKGEAAMEKLLTLVGDYMGDLAKHLGDVGQGFP